MSDERDVFPFDAYCCGKKMTKTYLEGGYVQYMCASGTHGRFFVISIDPQKQSYCSCGFGGAPMRTKDFGNFRLYHGCPYCGARYSIVKNDLHISFEVDGNSSTDVSEVALKSLHSIWDSIGDPIHLKNEGNERKLMKESVETVQKIIGVRDFFISYNKADKQWAKWIAGVLEQNGYTCLIQAWDFQPGNNFTLKMHEAINSTKRTIIVLSQQYLESDYCQSEWSAIFNKDPTGEKRLLIPVKISDIEPNGLLANNIYIDLYGLDEENAMKKLLYGVDVKHNPRKKPNYPG